MSNLIKTRQVLTVLVKNLNNPQPQIVSSELIAGELDMSIKETSNLLKIMHNMGMVISDAEGMKALITREGINCVNM